MRNKKADNGICDYDIKKIGAGFGAYCKVKKSIYRYVRTPP